jgi:transposase
MEWTVAIGVDTHRDRHVAVALDRLGAQLDALEVETTRCGYRRLREWAHALGEPAFALEGAASYGAGLAQVLLDAGERVFEVERPKRQERRHGKSDLIDAALAARRLVSGDGLAQLRGSGEARERLRLLLLERRSASNARLQTLNQLRALVLTAPPQLRERLEPRRGHALVTVCARLRGPDPTTAVARRLARRARLLQAEIDDVDRELAELTRDLAPDLLAEPGVGPVCAAQLIVSCGNPRRLRNEACFARLAGVSPLPASSGLRQRHRLNRGGDRQLNYALHVIAIHRTRHHPETRAYHQRLLDSGKTPREARRCIKRALARRLYHTLAANPALHAT